MSANPVSFRLPINIAGKAEPEVVEAVGWHDDAINDLQQAIPELKSQIDALKTSTAGTGSGTTNVTTASESTTIVTENVTGTVNNQTGNVAYTTLPSDYGALLVFDDAAAIAVTLTTAAIQTPFFLQVINYGAGLVTLTPATGNISYPGNLAAASMPVPQGSGAAIFYDGVNWWAFLFIAAPAGFSGTIVTAKLTVGGTNGSMVFAAGILTASTPAT